MDFSKLKRPSSTTKPVNPEEIFGKLPSLPNLPNDLWRGQTQALREWHQNRNKDDVLISLNTGAGKTLVGLLIAQSLVNEDIGNVLYACSTIDLVEQTAKEADKLGIKYTKRISGHFHNDLFEAEKAFCITTYASILNPFTSFRNQLAPSAIIFDDAHVAEQIMRGQFTLFIDRLTNNTLFAEICNEFRQTFIDLGKETTFQEITEGSSQYILMAPPNCVRERANQVNTILRNYGIPNTPDLKFPYHYIKDNIKDCVILFGSNGIEISPPFIPVNSINCFSKGLKRIYLSATLDYTVDFARAFGKLPDLTIQPPNDAGNGERLILFSKHFSDDALSVINQLNHVYKTLIAVPSYSEAGKWKAFGTPPTKETFTEKLNDFRVSSTGCFILVSRLDGIDLPDNTCRVMLIDGLPAGLTLLERFQSEILNMQNFYSSKISNRLTQLFGRINRGRNDYGVFIIKERNINNWLHKNRNLALLPELLRKQILIGHDVHEQLDIKNAEQVLELTKKVLDRDQDWLDYYNDNISSDIDSNIKNDIENREKELTKAAIAGVNFMSLIWNNNYQEARNILESEIENVARIDTKVAGWHNIWIGMCYGAQGDFDSEMNEYQRARTRFGGQLTLPGTLVSHKGIHEEDLTGFEKSLAKFIFVESVNSYESEYRKLQKAFIPFDVEGSSPKQLEEAVRRLGEELGYDAIRPDNDSGTGPDVLWLDIKKQKCLSFELKTDKKIPAIYSKNEDIGQGHNHLAWIKDNYPEFTHLGLVYIGPDGQCSYKASPSETMYLVSLQHIIAIKNSLTALIQDIRKLLPLERSQRLKESYDSYPWHLEGLFNRISKQRLQDLKPVVSGS